MILPEFFTDLKHMVAALGDRPRPYTHRSWQPLLGPKKSPSQSIYIGPKVHIVAT